MIDIEKVLADKTLVKNLTGQSLQDFNKQLKIYNKKLESKRKLIILNTSRKQLFFMLFSAHVTVTLSVQAILFGAKDKVSVYRWKERLNIQNVKTQPYKQKINSLSDFIGYMQDYIPPKTSSRKIKTIGEFFKKFPNLQLALTQKVELIVPFSLSSTPMEDETRRLRIVAKTVDNKRLCILMDFRKEILENNDLTPTQAVQLLYIARYKNLGELNIKEMAYLWGTSVEYISRVLKSTLKTLNLSEEKFKEALYE